MFSHFLTLFKKNKKHKLSVVAIFKNEADYIYEWIAYHLLMGVEHFYIADNDSSDETAEILKKLENAGLVTYQYWPENDKAQHKWYNHASSANRAVNEHVKSIVKPAAVRKVWAHASEFKDGFKYLMFDGAEAEFYSETPKSGRTISVAPLDAKVLHYAVKSEQEFYEKKFKKGRANLGRDAVRHEHYFKNHDLNDEEFNLYFYRVPVGL